MIDRDHGLSLSRQAEALGISRGAIYYRAQATSADDLALMRRIDELHLDYPFAGSRMLRGLLNAEGHEVGRLHVSTLMRRMGIEAIRRRPKTSKPAPGHKVYPHLLRKLAVTRPIPADTVGEVGEPARAAVWGGVPAPRPPMSLRPQPPLPPVPEGTARVAQAAFRRGNPYVLLRDRVGAVFDDAGFADLYPRLGQPAYAPWRLALVTLMQFREGLSDRQAAEAVRSRIVVRTCSRWS